MFIEKQLSHVDVVSFDIFDTLLLRPYVRPTDLFLHMEQHYGCNGFCNARISAEKQARAVHSECEDVTLDEIYTEIIPEFKSLKDKECDWEMMILRPNPEMVRVWRLARATGKKIIVASDMYLPRSLITKILQKNGLGDYDRLYVSGDCGHTKARGTLFEDIISDLGCRPHNILHIGDNRHSDYEMARQHGIRAYLYPQVIPSFLRENKRVAEFNKRCFGDLGASILISLLAMRWHVSEQDENYWHKLGYEYGGPIIYAYMRWIQKLVHNDKLSNLLFVARDGYTPLRVFKTFESTINCEYVYAPRFLNLSCRLDYAPNDLKGISAIVRYFASLYPDVSKLPGYKNLRTIGDYELFIKNNKALFSKYAAAEKKVYKNYLDSKFIRNARTGLVDTLTGQFSSQKLIENVSGNKVVGFYWTVIDWLAKDKDQYKYHCFKACQDWANHANVQTKNWDFMEFLMTAPELPIKGIDARGKPIYDANPTQYELLRKNIYPDVSNGAVQFAKDVKNLFNGIDIFLCADVVIAWVNCLCDMPQSVDIKNMSSLRYAADAEHGDYQVLFCSKIPFSQILLHPRRSKHLIKASMWQTPGQRVFIAVSKILRPNNYISINMGGLKRLKICILPKLKRRYIEIGLSFGPKCYYMFILGCRKGEK